jgi:hypothetical protein
MFLKFDVVMKCPDQGDGSITSTDCIGRFLKPRSVGANFTLTMVRLTSETCRLHTLCD